MQLYQPEYAESLGKDFLPWKWESGKVTPQLLQDYEAQHGAALQKRYSPEERDWFRQADD